MHAVINIVIAQYIIRKMSHNTSSEPHNEVSLNIYNISMSALFSCHANYTRMKLLSTPPWKSSPATNFIIAARYMYLLDTFSIAR